MTQKSLIAKKKNLRIILKYLNNNKIRKIFIEFKRNLNNYENFAVAVSGGPDSLSLSFLSKCFSIKNRAEIKFYIVDHKLRKNSARNIKNAGEKCLIIYKNYNKHFNRTPKSFKIPKK